MSQVMSQPADEMTEVRSIALGASSFLAHLHRQGMTT